jgi:hypothetical protein
MSTFTKTRGFGLLVGAAALGQMAVASTPANATAFAYSALEVTNFSLNTAPFGGFNTFQFTSHPLSVSLNGTTVNSPSILISNVSGGTTNQQQLTLGTTPFAADNLYFGVHRPTFQNPNADFAVADTHQTDTLISRGTGNFGTQAGAQATTATSAGAGDTGADNSLSWNFVVSAAELSAAGGAIALDFSFDTLSNIFAKTQFDGETARATLNMSIELVHNGVPIGQAVAFDENFNLQFPGEAGNPNEISQSFTDADFDPMIINAAGGYTLNILYDSSVQVSSANLPEPGTLGLLGLGLLGLGAAGYRRNQS